MDKQKTIESLRAMRDSVGKKLRAEKNLKKKDEIYKGWEDLNEQILVLRKELRSGNDERISG